MTVVALVGAQWGSEAKGLIAADIADEFDVHIRTGAPNAGHTFYHEGLKWVARSVPCGWVNPEAHLVIGPGALIDAELLMQEVGAIEAEGFDIRGRLWIDLNAGLIDPVRHHGFEGGVHGAAHELIGSTGEGVGPARMAKIARSTFPRDLAWTKYERVQDRPDLFEWIARTQIIDTSRRTNKVIDSGARVLLEGTQGCGLSLVHGDWPFTTSTDTNAGQLAVDAGISPSFITRSILVARTFPIRVYGNSGPMGEEITWEELGVPEETTTVTRKVRRVAMWSDGRIRKAIELNRPAELAITFLNYLYPETAGITEWDKLTSEAQEWIRDKQASLGVPVRYVSTTADSVIRL